MKVLVYVLAGVLGLLGLVFVAAAGQGNAIARLAIGLICLGAAGALVALSRLRPIEQIHHMKLDLPADTQLQQIKCGQCGAALDSKSVRVAAGAVFVHCQYCGAEYQLEEAPKW